MTNIRRALRRIAWDALLATVGVTIAVFAVLWYICAIALQVVAVPLVGAIDRLGESRWARWARKICI
jgi:hypothetical protein